MVKVEGGQLIVLFEPDQPLWARNETKDAVRDASYGISQRGKYSFGLSEEEMARELDPHHSRGYMRRSDQSDHKPEKFVELVTRTRVVV